MMLCALLHKGAMSILSVLYYGATKVKGLKNARYDKKASLDGVTEITLIFIPLTGLWKHERS